MRTIQPVNAYRRDLRRVKSNPHHRRLDAFLISLLELLAADKPLPASNRDHSLSGDWADHRECHVKPDLLLIYRKPDPETLQLVRLGSHSDLFR
ncbi:MAG: type II toxin-antitoxin system YafQ family toxin [Acetobacteraceae bacterium]|nr:type II toxin-antitoxin system YafQ family toxin [Acetobacteraceae bacterium]MBV9777569.1 type II toxin-antitoxin system YafQ family toxin [Acetobacteraceae bacterium]